MSAPPPLRLAALMSGGGRTLLNIVDHIERGKLQASVELVIASRTDIIGVERARARGFEPIVIARRNFDSSTALNDAINQTIRQAGIDLVCLCGYTRMMRIDPDLVGRVINIHPALLPDFGGPGMYGERVHRAVLDAGRDVSGCTVHYVDEQYDHGPIILQRRCPAFEGDTPQTLAARVFEQECIAYPAAIRLIAGGDVRLEGNRVVLSPSAQEQLAST